MTTYILRRLLALIFVLWLVTLVAFGLMHSIPGGPFDEGKMPLSPTAKANILAKYGLDKPIYVQYFNYMSNALRGDFGVSFQTAGEPVISLISRTWRVSFILGGTTVVIALSVGMLLGIIAAVRQNSLVDYAVTMFATFGMIVPNFVVSIWLILVFAVQLKWLPLGGWGDWKQMILPMIALGIGPMGIAARYTRASLVDTLTADYMRTARAKGLSDRVAVMRHALKNALIPIITVLGPRIPDLITGTIFVESIFRVPGLGKFFVSSVLSRDYPMIMAIMLLTAAVWGLVYLLTDVLYTVLDPRIRLA